MTGPERDGAFAGHLTPGNSPALLLVDPVAAYVEPESPLFLDSGAAALEAMSRLAHGFRRKDLPVFWTGVRYSADGSDGGHFFAKVPALRVFAGEAPLAAFPDGLQPQDGEQVVIKQYPSAFFGTGMDRTLRDAGIDTLFIAGFSTSGCVRASALDAIQYGFIPIVVEDACADRSDDIHRQNLRDVGAKYAEVMTSDEAIRLLASAD